MIPVPRLRRLSKGRSTKPGERPGLLRRPEGAKETSVELILYDSEGFEQLTAETAEEVLEARGRRQVLWVRVRGLASVSTLQKLAEGFGIHRLALEDVLALNSRAKLESYDSGSFFVGQVVEKREQFISKQAALFWGDGFVVSFDEGHGSGFEPVVARVKAGRGKIRHLGADYLAYALIDKVVDDYAPVLEAYEELVDELESETLRSQDQEMLQHLHLLRAQMSEIRRHVRPLRDVLRQALDGELEGFGEEVRVYLRDTHDHAVQALDDCEALRESISSVTDLVFSLQSQRMNDIVKVLTIISTIFIPLSFLAGLYGMNFDTQQPGNLPELRQPYGYAVLLTVMAVLALGMLIWFWRKGWIFTRR